MKFLREYNTTHKAHFKVNEKGLDRIFRELLVEHLHKMNINFSVFIEIWNKSGAEFISNDYFKSIDNWKKGEFSRSYPWSGIDKLIKDIDENDIYQDYCEKYPFTKILIHNEFTTVTMYKSLENVKEELIEIEKLYEMYPVLPVWKELFNSEYYPFSSNDFSEIIKNFTDWYKGGITKMAMDLQKSELFKIFKNINESIELDRLFWDIPKRSELEDYIEEFLIKNNINFRKTRFTKLSRFILMMDGRDIPFSIITYHDSHQGIISHNKYRLKVLTSIIYPPPASPDTGESNEVFFPENLKELIKLISEKIPKVVSTDAIKQVNESEKFQIQNIIPGIDQSNPEKIISIIEYLILNFDDVNGEDALDDIFTDLRGEGYEYWNMVKFKKENFNGHNVRLFDIYKYKNTAMVNLNFYDSDWEDTGITDMYLKDFDIEALIQIINMLISIPEFKKVLTNYSNDILSEINESMDQMNGGSVGKIINGLNIKIKNYNDYLTGALSARKDITDEYKPMLLNMMRQIVINIKEKYDQDIQEILDEEEPGYSGDMYLNDSNLEETSTYIRFISMEIDDNSDLVIIVDEGNEDDGWDNEWNASHLEIDDLLLIINFCLSVPKIQSSLTIDALKIMNESLYQMTPGTIGKVDKKLGYIIKTFNGYLSNAQDLQNEISKKYRPILINVIEQIVVNIKDKYDQNLKEILKEYDEEYSDDMYMDTDDESISITFNTIICQNTNDSRNKNVLDVKVNMDNDNDSWDDSWSIDSLTINDLLMIVNYCLDIPKIKSALSIDALKTINESKKFVLTNVIQDLGTRIDKIEDFSRKKSQLEIETLKKYKPILLNILKEIVNSVKDSYDVEVNDIIEEYDVDYIWQGPTLDRKHIEYEDNAEYIHFMNVSIRQNGVVIEVGFGNDNTDWEEILNVSELTLSDLMNIINYLLRIPKIQSALSFDALKTINEINNYFI